MKYLSLSVVTLFLIGFTFDSVGQSGISFTTSKLTGATLDYPTTLAFGPDNRLYVTQQDGTIFAYTVQKNGPNNYSVSNTETINLIKNIPNHSDVGVVENFGTARRQLTGIVATGTAANPILYICSSDFRIGGGGELGDIGLDTNSGMISKLTKNGSSWSMVHVVIGLPRAEENHSPNGLSLDEVNNILYVAQGGNTNAGSPSNNFGFLAEYALSAAILEIDLDVINSQFGGSYTLPTLDDPTRPNNPDGTDVGDPFGGNDGLNQAKYVIGGPVQIYAPGFRLSYDLLITKTPGKAGRMYTIGNGGNPGWGGYPENEGQPNVTNNRLFDEPGSTEPTLNDDKINNLDGLHYVTGRGYYGGHPVPIRANPASAGWYWFNNDTNQGHFEQNPTVDWPPYPVSLANPVESDFRNAGVNDGALYTWSGSTNGMAEYTSTAFFNGAMAGDLLTASWDSGIHRIELTEDGTAVTRVTKLFSGFGGLPLDVIAQGDGQIFPGTIWSIVYAETGVTVFEPVGTAITCSGDINNFNLDDDGDGYSNGDETLNNTDPCSPSSRPADFDLDLVSDLTDPNDDNDAFSDIVDKFALDANNGMTTQVPLDYAFLNGNPGFGLFGLGQTGLMTNNVDSYEDNFDVNDPALIAGGAVGALSVPAQTGDAVTNNQKYAFQFGIPISQSVATFTLHSRLLGAPFFNGATGTELGTQSHGIYFGNGDQNNYFKFVLHANNGNPGFQILVEQNGSIVNQQMIPIANILSTGQIDLFIEVDAVTGAVQCSYQNSNTPTPVNVGQSFTVSGNLLSLLVNHTDAVAVGVIASCGNKTPFSATWDFIRVTTTTSTPTLTNVIRINAGGPAQNFGGEVWVADQNFTGGSVYTSTNSISNTTQDQIYQTERFGTFSYAIPVGQAGTYAVDLHFAEIYYGQVGQRRFNINIENGQFVRNNFDIIQTFGANNAAFVLRADNLNITDGTINITFTSVTDYAKISGIAVGRYNNAPANTPPTIVQAYPDQNVPSTQTTLVIQLNQIFNDNGGVNNLTFSVPDNTNSALISNTQIAGTQLTFTLSGTTGSGNITLRATDASNAFVEDVFQLTVGPAGPLQLTNIIRINSAGPPQNFAGEIWVADQYAIGGAGLTQGGEITNTTKDEIYQSERHGTINYAIPVPNAGTYAVDLHFSENTFNAGGARTFNINVENGQFIRNNFDLFQTAGAKNQAYILRADNLSITDGTINITLTAVINEATIGGVAVGRYEPTPTNTPPLVMKLSEDKFLLSSDGSFAIDLNQIFTDDGGVNNLTFSVSGNTNAGLISNTQITNGQVTFTLSGQTGDGNITLRATDASSTFVEDVFHLTVTPGTNQPIAGIIRINAGGPAQNFNGENWAADQYFTGGTVYSTNSAINNTTNDPIFQTERFGNFSYAIPVPHAGIYGVDFHFAEIYFNTTGSRVFNVNIENGQFVRNNVDLMQMIGANNTAGLLHVENLNITDGLINITFTSVVDNAKVSGIAVNEYANPNPNTPPVVVQAPAAQSVPSNQGTVVLQLGQIFNDDGGVNFLNFSVSNNTNAALLSNTQIVAQQITFTLSGTTGNGTITLRATDTNGEFVETTFQLTVTPPVPTPPVVVQAPAAQSVPNTQATVVLQLGQIFNDDGGVNNLTFTVQNNSNPALLSNTQIVGTQITFTLSGTTGSTTITLRATDASNTFVETNFQLTVTPPGPQTLTNVIRINAGGPAQNFSGEAWVADQYFTGGTVYSTTTPIANTTQDPIYQTERFGNVSYAIPVGQAGTYAVDLHFAEIYFGQATQRVFNINIENGQFVRNSFDIIQTYGASNAAFVLRADNLNITDGTINITFTTVVDNAKISGIAVGRYSGAPPANTPPVVSQAPAPQSVPSTQPTVVLQLGQIFSDDGGANNLTFSVPNNTNAALLSNTQISGTQVTFTLSGTTGSGTITLRATDASNAFVQTTFQLTVTPAGPPTLTNVIRINAGGPAQNFGGQAWVADQNFTGGSVYSTTNPIANTTQDQIYQTERFGNFSYAIPVGQAGTYAVDLHFAEIYYGQVGQRRFNINIENGQFVRNNFDIIQTYGANNAAFVLRADNLNITDGTINITFTSVTDFAKVSGIAVGRYSSGSARMITGTGHEPIVEKPDDVTIHEGQAWTYQVQASDPDDDQLSYSITNLPSSLYINKTTGLIKGTIETNAKTFPVTITVTDSNGLYTEENFTITVAPAKSLREIHDLKFVVYPNPTQRDEFHVKLEVKQQERWNFTLMDFAGRQISLGSFELHQGVQELTFDITPYNLSAGIYYLAVQNGQTKKNVKLAVQ